MITPINEALKLGDLTDTVLPFISIDEYESKIGKDTVVVALFCTDKNPAKDLNSFIQKSAIKILDTDISPAPTIEGYYVVFVEILRSPKFVYELKTLLEDLKTLVEIDLGDWACKCFGDKNIHSFDVETLQRIIDIKQDKSEEDNDMNSKNEALILSYLKPSILDNATIIGNKLILERYGKKKAYEIIDFGHIDRLCEKYDLNNLPIRYENRPLLREAEGLLGDNWELVAFDIGIVVSRNDSDYSLFIK